MFENLLLKRGPENLGTELGGGREASNNRISSAAGPRRLLTTGQAMLGGQGGC